MHFVSPGKKGDAGEKAILAPLALLALLAWMVFLVLAAILASAALLAIGVSLGLKARLGAMAKMVQPVAMARTDYPDCRVLGSDVGPQMLHTVEPRSMKPIALSDDQLTAIMRAAAPLPPADRGLFLEEVARELQSQPTIGDGVVGRVCAEVQRAYLQPPMVFERRIPNVQPHTVKFR